MCSMSWQRCLFLRTTSSFDPFLRLRPCTASNVFDIALCEFALCLRHHRLLHRLKSESTSCQPLWMSPTALFGRICSRHDRPPAPGDGWHLRVRACHVRRVRSCPLPACRRGRGLPVCSSRLRPSGGLVGDPSPSKELSLLCSSTPGSNVCNFSWRPSNGG